MTLGQLLLLLLGLVFGSQSLVHLKLNLGVAFRFSLLFLTRTKQREKTNRWQGKNFLHVSFRLRSGFVIRKAVTVLRARANRVE